MLHDAIYATSKSVLATASGRKAIVVLTDGCDFGSKTTLEQAIEQAQLADVIIYSILYTGWHGASFGPSFHCEALGVGNAFNPGLAVLHKLLCQTGGEVFAVTRTSPLRNIFMEITQQLQSAYELGYTPSSGLLPNTYHRLEVVMKDRALNARARQGFYARR